VSLCTKKRGEKMKKYVRKIQAKKMIELPSSEDINSMSYTEFNSLLVSLISSLPQLACNTYVRFDVVNIISKLKSYDDLSEEKQQHLSSVSRMIMINKSYSIHIKDVENVLLFILQKAEDRIQEYDSDSSRLSDI
jgi:hypothetical protein